MARHTPDQRRLREEDKQWHYGYDEDYDCSVDPFMVIDDKVYVLLLRVQDA